MEPVEKPVAAQQAGGDEMVDVDDSPAGSNLRNPRAVSRMETRTKTRWMPDAAMKSENHPVCLDNLEYVDIFCDEVLGREFDPVGVRDARQTDIHRKCWCVAAGTPNRGCWSPPTSKDAGFASTKVMSVSGTTAAATLQRKCGAAPRGRWWLNSSRLRHRSVVRKYCRRKHVRLDFLMRLKCWASHRTFYVCCSLTCSGAARVAHNWHGRGWLSTEGHVRHERCFHMLGGGDRHVVGWKDEIYARPRIAMQFSIKTRQSQEFVETISQRWRS